MKDYELTVVFHPDLEMNIDPALDKVKKLIETNGGEIVKEESEGKKRLSYVIKDQDFGIYYFFDVKLPAAAPGKISAVLNITDEVIRHLLVRTDPKKAKYAAIKKARAEAAAENGEAAEAETPEAEAAETTKTTEKGV